MIDSQYLSCHPTDIGIWRRQSLPNIKGRADFLCAHLCADISFTVSDCLFKEPYQSSITYPQATTLLVFGITGVSYFRFKDSEVECSIREGDVWLVNTDGAEMLRTTLANKEAKMSVIKYSTARINKAYKNSDEICTYLSHNHMVRLGCQEPSADWVSSLMDNPMHSAADRLIGEAKALELMARWITPNELASTQTLSPLQSVVDMLTRDLIRPPTLTALCRASDMSHTKLNREFKKHHGVTVFNWLRRYKLERAHFYLQDGSRSITEIAFTCGFSSASHFSQAYKTNYGKSPSVVRDHS
jgi:AraC family transcriptional regulator